MTILSKISTSVQVLPKPSLSILRVLGGGVLASPVGLAVAGTAVAGVGAFELIKHKDQIETGLGKIGNSIKTTIGGSTTAVEKASSSISSSTPPPPTIDDSMLVPILLGGSALVLLFILTRK